MDGSPIKVILRITGFFLSLLVISAAILLLRKSALLTGGILLVLAVVLFLLSIQAIEKNPLSDEELGILRPYLVPALFFLAMLALTGGLIFNITIHNRTHELNRQATAEWLLSLLCLSITVFWLARWKPLRLSVLKGWITENRIELILVAMVVIASLLIRVVALTSHPYPWSGDEASVGMDARLLLHGDITYWFGTGWSGQPYTSFLPTSLSMLIFGETILAVKMTSAIVGTLAVLATYLLAREWFGWKVALVAGGFMAAYPFQVQFSRLGVHNIFDSLMAPLVIWLVFRAARTSRLTDYLLAGIATGLTFYTYVGTRLVLAMGVGTIIYIAIRRRGYIKNNLTQLGTYLAALLVTLAPIATFFLKYPDLFLTRIGQEGIFLNGWLPNQVKITGQSVGQILLDQFSRTILVFFSQNAGGGLLNFDRPYLTVLGAIFFIAGLAFAFRFLFDERYFILQAWFWSVLTLGGFLTLNPPASTRLVMTTPATALFIAVGVWQVSKVLLQLKFSPKWVYGLSFALVLALGFQNISFYFNTYRVKDYFEDANGELAMEAGQELQRLGNDYDYYLFGAPRVFAGFPTIEFLAPGVQKFDLLAESVAGLTLTPGRGAFITATPENQNFLQQVVERYPGGEWEIIPRHGRQEVLYYAYILSPQLVTFK